MNPDDIQTREQENEEISRRNEEKSALIRKVFESPDGERVLQILKDHFQTDVPSAPLAGWDTNQTFYRDGNKAPFSLIHQVLEGTWQGEL